MGWCGYGEPTKPDAKVVLYCDQKSYTSFNWPIPGGECLLVLVCEEHADELERRVKLADVSAEGKERSDP